MTTATQPLLDYTALAAHSSGLAFLDSRGVTGEITYADLDTRARTAAAALHERGLRPGDRAVLPMPSSPDYFTVLAACLLAGVAPCTVVIPSNPQDVQSAGMRQFAAVLSVVRPAAVIAADEDTAKALAQVPGPLYLHPDDLRHAPPESVQPAIPGPDTVHHIQLTSGSTTAPKAATLTYAQVSANVNGIRTAFQLTPGHDRICNWLPLHHDMGFVVALTALHSGTPLDSMSPMGFLRDPLSWLRHISQRGATITSGPPFGYRTAVERYRRTPAQDLDLSRLRQAHVGAEPIPYSVLVDFRDTFAAHGLATDTLMPCYGMAETVLGATMSLKPYSATEHSWGRVKAVRLDREALHHHNTITPAHDDRPDITVVACGQPVGGLTAEIRHPDGTRCGDNEIGEIHLHGDSVMAGYLNPDGRPTPVPERTHATGDLGFHRDGDLYIVGRLKEMIVVRGRNLPPYDVEQTIETLPAVGAGNSAVFSHADNDGEHVIAVIETRTPADQAAALRLEIATLVRQSFGFTPREIILVRRGQIPRTTSGKRQRAQLRRQYLTGGLT
ncbi:AMP-binding protein [Streptomyces sp. NPDC048331]|uniref:AMP-binding protein n=1 Tax=Streptomyces sp. NPDC048331 TaxID=3365534 RepID=UPI003710A544